MGQHVPVSLIRARPPAPAAGAGSGLAWSAARRLERDARGGLARGGARAPALTDAGAPFPFRDLIIFLTFCVILATLVLQGLTLPGLIRRLGVRDDGAEEREEEQARLMAADAALDRLDELGEEDWVRDDTSSACAASTDYRKRRFAAQRDGEDDDGIEDRSLAYQRLTREVLRASAGRWSSCERGADLQRGDAPDRARARPRGLAGWRSDARAH